MSYQGGMNTFFAPPAQGATPGQPNGQAGPGAPAPQQPHPTMPYGQNLNQPQQPTGQPTGFPFGQPGYGAGMQPGYTPPAPQAQHPTMPYGQQPATPPAQMPQQFTMPGGPSWGGPAPQQPQAPQWGQPSQQPQPNPSGLPAGIDANTRLDGPGIPNELRGRTIGQFVSIYNTLAQDWLNRQGGVAPPAQAPSVPAGYQPGGSVRAGQQPAPQGQQSPQGQQPQQQRWDWSNPAESIRNVVREEVGTMVAPVLQRTAAASVAEARTAAASSIPDFGALEAGIMQKLAPMSPEHLSNPQTWINAARLVRGELMETGQYNPGAFAPQQTPRVEGGGHSFGQPAQPNGGVNPASLNFGPGYQAVASAYSQPAAPQPQMQTPQARSVPAWQFFTENPTPPAFHELGAGALNPAERFVAQQFGMTPEQYMAWKGGVQR